MGAILAFLIFVGIMVLFTTLGPAMGVVALVVGVVGLFLLFLLLMVVVPLVAVLVGGFIRLFRN